MKLITNTASPKTSTWRVAAAAATPLICCATSSPLATTRARTAHDVSATTEREHLPEPVGSLVDRRAKAAERRRKEYLNWQEQTHTMTSN